MQYDEFIDRVQDQARLESRERAIEVTQAVLETLGERLDRKVKDGVAAQLPGELKEFLLKRQNTDRYELQEFYNRVGARADTGYYDASKRAKAVMAVLQEAVSSGEVENMRSQLPTSYADLFTGRPRGPGFPSLER